jgi:hypothetical protein
MSEKKSLIEVVPADHLEPPKGDLLFHEAEAGLTMGNLRGVRIPGQEAAVAARRKKLDAEHEELMRKVAAGEVDLPQLTEDIAESPSEG